MRSRGEVLAAHRPHDPARQRRDRARGRDPALHFHRTFHRRGRRGGFGAPALALVISNFAQVPQPPVLDDDPRQPCFFPACGRNLKSSAGRGRPRRSASLGAPERLGTGDRLREAVSSLRTSQSAFYMPARTSAAEALFDLQSRATPREAAIQRLVAAITPAIAPPVGASARTPMIADTMSAPANR